MCCQEGFQYSSVISHRKDTPAPQVHFLTCLCISWTFLLHFLKEVFVFINLKIVDATRKLNTIRGSSPNYCMLYRTKPLLAKLNLLGRSPQRDFTKILSPPPLRVLRVQ
jgi:hypothetical protein